MMGLRRSRVFEDVRCCHKEHLYWSLTILSDLQLTYGLGLQKMVHLQLTLMAASTSSENTCVSGMAAEKYVAVKLQLIGCKKYITNT